MNLARSRNFISHQFGKFDSPRIRSIWGQIAALTLVCHFLAGSVFLLSVEPPSFANQYPGSEPFVLLASQSSNAAPLVRVRIDIDDSNVVKLIARVVAESRFAAKVLVKDDTWDIRFRTGADRNTIVVERDGDAPVSTQTRGSLTAELIHMIIAQEYRWQSLNALENKKPDTDMGIELKVVPLRKKPEVTSYEPLRCTSQPADPESTGTTAGHLKEMEWFIFHIRNTGRKAAYVYILTLDGNGTTKPLFKTGNTQTIPADGKWYSTTSESFGTVCDAYYIESGASGADVYKAFATAEPINTSEIFLMGYEKPSGMIQSLENLYTGKLLDERAKSWSTASIRFVTGRDAPVTYDISIDALPTDNTSNRSLASPKFESTSSNVLERYTFAGEQASFESIHAAFERVIVKSTPYDLFIFRFAGEMRVSDGDIGKITPDKIILDLAGASASGRNSARRELTLELLQVWLSRLRARSRLLIFDSELESAEFSTIGRQLVGTNAWQKMPNRSTIVWGSVITKGRPSRNGFLSANFDSSFSTDSDSSRDGSLTVFELQDAINQTVFRESRQKQRLSSIEEGGDFELAKVRVLADTSKPASAAAPAGQRADRFVESKSDSKPLNVIGKSYALIFATNNYDNYPTLKNPLNDANDLKRALEDDYGFEVEIKDGLTRQQIWDTLFEYQKKEFAPNDQLLIFFAGHGTYKPAPYDLGYLIAKDSPKIGPPSNIYFSFQDLAAEIDRIKSEHILLILDVCNGGALGYVGKRAADSGGDYGEETPEKLINRSLENRARKFLTSGGNEYVSDGQGRNSPFTYRFLKLLREPHEAKKDGLITFLELASDLAKIPNQTPQAGDLYGNKVGSDFLFQVKRRN